MNNSGLQVIKNENFNVHSRINGEQSKKKKYLIRFTIFIILFLTIFGGIFFIKDKFENVKSFEENLNFQKQKLAEERLSMEKTFKEENDKLLKLQLEYEEKNKQLNETLNSLKVKEETLDSEILKVEELKELLKKQLVDIYGLNIDRQYDNKTVENDETKNSSSGLLEEENGNEAIHTSIMAGEDKADDKVIDQEKMLSIANADWFIKFDSLGEFSY